AGSTLNRTNVGGLAVKWTFNTPGAVYGTPAVVDGVVYDVDAQANVFALDAKTGGVKWATNVGPATLLDYTTASPLVTDSLVIIGDLSGIVHALDRATGVVKWAQRPNSYGTAAIYGTPSATAIKLGPLGTATP